MRYITAQVFAIFIAVTASRADAAIGFQHFSINDPQGPPIEVGVWYPTAAEPKLEAIESNQQTVAHDAAVEGTGRPLVVISHGHGGSYAGHLDTAMALANAGFVVAALTHNGDSWNDQSNPTAVWERPRQFKLLTDYMLGEWGDHKRIDANHVGAFGFSAGGFTVLVAAGGEPDLRTIADHCKAHPAFEVCQILDQHPLSLDDNIVWTHDPRIKAVVSAAPALGFAFDSNGLAAVCQPLQLWWGEDDQVLPHPYYAEAVRLALPNPPETHVVADAGHNDFLPPCSAKLATHVPAICTSKPGFDRAAFHERFDHDIVAFFTRTLR